MCGIAGIIRQEIENKEKIIGQMVERINHRGPDDDGFFVDGFVGLGMRRLAIIDLNTGKQPITTEDGKLIIFFNGEIYNYKELREELLVKGYKFKTQGDTEVILNMFVEYGEKMLVRLRGMFAICIYNIETREVFLARDFFGIKPLYYLVNSVDIRCPQGKIVAFSSEIKSFLDFPNFVPEVNDKAVINYLSFQYNPLTETFFKNVYKLPPAHFLKINAQTGDIEIKKYWSFEFNQMSRRHLDTNYEKEMSKAVFDTIKDSVEHHMISDVPVGAFLSGGVDSSIITTLMSSFAKASARQSKVKTFTVGFDTLTEGVESKQTSDFLNTDHTEIKVGPEEYFDVLQKAVYHFDEPVADPSAIGIYFLAREARKYVKVILSGEGADELFGGYNIYLAPFAKQKLVWLPKWILNAVIKTFDFLGFDFWGTNYLRRVNMKLEDWYIGNASVFNQKEINYLWKSDVHRVKREKPEIENDFILKKLYGEAHSLSDSTKMQYIDINTWLVGDILAKADKMTMAHSLELRVPFLDTHVADLARILPDKFKWRNGRTKYLLREAFKKVIPESTRNRKKLGFPTPIRDWLTNDRTDVYKTILENEYIKTHMDTDYVQNIIDKHLSKSTDNSRKMYLLLMLALWYNVFIKPTK